MSISAIQTEATMQHKSLSFQQSLLFFHSW